MLKDLIGCLLINRQQPQGFGDSWKSNSLIVERIWTLPKKLTLEQRGNVLLMGINRHIIKIALTRKHSEHRLKLIMITNIILIFALRCFLITGPFFTCMAKIRLQCNNLAFSQLGSLTLNNYGFRFFCLNSILVLISWSVRLRPSLIHSCNSDL